MENTIIVLIGYPWSWKLTIAKKIKKIVGNTIIIDNHSSNNAIFPVIDLWVNLDGGNCWKYINKIRDIQIEFIRDWVPLSKNLIFTLFLPEDWKSEHPDFLRIENLVRERWAHLYPVKLVCDKPILKERLASYERKKSNKLTSIALLEEILAANSHLFNVNAYPKGFEIDNSHISALECANEIVKRVEEY